MAHPKLPARKANKTEQRLLDKITSAQETLDALADQDAKFRAEWLELESRRKARVATRMDALLARDRAAHRLMARGWTAGDISRGSTMARGAVNKLAQKDPQ